MNNDQKIIIPNGGIILNRVHLEIGDGFVRHSYELDERFTNRRNFIMGGFLSTMLDGLCGHALHTVHDKQHVTLELKTIFLAPAKVGKLLGKEKSSRLEKLLVFLNQHCGMIQVMRLPKLLQLLKFLIRN